jgi:hypothetical protein
VPRGAADALRELPRSSAEALPDSNDADVSDDPGAVLVPARGGGPGLTGPVAARCATVRTWPGE